MFHTEHWSQAQNKIDTFPRRTIYIPVLSVHSLDGISAKRVIRIDWDLRGHL